MPQVYSYRSSTAGKQLPAQIVGEELERIRAKEGKLTAPVVVEEARPEDAPLHPSFEWDDQIAAERYREDQARQIIRSVRVVKVVEDGPGDRKVINVRKYVSVKPDGESRHYLPAEDAMIREDLKQQLLKQVLAQLEGLKRRYAQLEELAEIFAHVEKLKDLIA